MVTENEVKYRGHKQTKHNQARWSEPKITTKENSHHLDLGTKKRLLNHNITKHPTPCDLCDACKALLMCTTITFYAIILSSPGANEMKNPSIASQRKSTPRQQINKTLHMVMSIICWWKSNACMYASAATTKATSLYHCALTIYIWENLLHIRI